VRELGMQAPSWGRRGRGSRYGEGGTLGALVQPNKYARAGMKGGMLDRC